MKGQMASYFLMSSATLGLLIFNLWMEWKKTKEIKSSSCELKCPIKQDQKKCWCRLKVCDRLDTPFLEYLCMKHMTGTTSFSLFYLCFPPRITFLVKLEILADEAFTMIQTPSKWFSCVLVEFVVFHSLVTCQENWALRDSSSSRVDARRSVRFFTCLSYRKENHNFYVLKYLIIKSLSFWPKLFKTWIALDNSLSSG